MDEIEFLSLGPRGYEKYGTGERHGSWETTWKKEDGNFVRLVAVSVTPPPEDSSTYRVEVWAGAALDERYVRHLIASWDAVNEQDLRESDFISKVTGAIQEEALRRANSFQPRDLVDTGFLGVQEERVQLSAHLGRPPESQC